MALTPLLQREQQNLEVAKLWVCSVPHGGIIGGDSIMLRGDSIIASFWIRKLRVLTFI